MLDQTARLTYLYVGSADVETDLQFYRDQLGGKVVWPHWAASADAPQGDVEGVSLQHTETL